MMTNETDCSMLESPSTSYDDEMDIGASKKRLEPTTKELMRETRLVCRSERYLVRKRHNIKVKISIMKKIH